MSREPNLIHLVLAEPRPALPESALPRPLPASVQPAEEFVLRLRAQLLSATSDANRAA